MHYDCPVVHHKDLKAENWGPTPQPLGGKIL